MNNQLLKILFFTLLSSIVSFSYAQSVGIGTTTPDPNAILHIVSNDQGLMIPKIDSTTLINVTTPTLDANDDGLMFYVHDKNAFVYWDGDSLDWYLLNENFNLGSTGNDLDWVKTGTTVYNSTDNIGIGTSTPKYRLDVVGDARVGAMGSSDTIQVLPTDFVMENNGTTAKKYTISIAGNTWSPANITIEEGDTVEWVNANDGNHNVNGTIATYPSNPESFGNATGSSWTYKYVFNTEGLYDFRCDPHFGAGMVGTILVEPKASDVREIQNNSGSWGIASSGSGSPLAAYVKIPVGYKVDKVRINSKGGAYSVDVYEVSLLDGSVTSVGSGAVNTDFSLSTSVAYSSSKTLLIHIADPVTDSEPINGGFVFISPL